MQFCLLVVADLDTGFVVGITKKRGPEFLLNRITFPGGKLEEGESPEQAAARELQEEAGIWVPPQQWLLVESRHADGDTVHVLAAASDRTLYARSREEEPVWHLNIERHLQYCRRQPMQYAPDFEATLRAALDCLHRQAQESYQRPTGVVEPLG
jgi:8-oxo-dGTP pyrophosphatase MutT (NUDIX family)